MEGRAEMERCKESNRNMLAATPRARSGRDSHGLARSCAKVAMHSLIVCLFTFALSPALQAVDCPNAGGRGAACLITSINNANLNGGVNTITLGRGTYRLFEAEQRELDGVTGLPSIGSKG